MTGVGALGGVGMRGGVGSSSSLSGSGVGGSLSATRIAFSLVAKDGALRTV